MIYAVIMAGGMGIRFWPKSRKDTPKQFLSTIGDTTMIQATIERIKKLIPISNICIVTNQNYVDKIQMLVPELPSENIFVEPMNKETAACIGLATINIYKRDKDAIIIALPSDHIIGENDKFIKILSRASKVVKYNDIIATIGITPSRPETGYGYIEKAILLDSKEGIDVYKVSRFVEKPDKEKASCMLKSGKYFWNSGMFIFRAEMFLREMQEYLPETYELLMKIYKNLGTSDIKTNMETIYSMIKPISIDYGIMEKTRNICVFKGDILWDDVGSWTALERFFEKDSNGNIVKGLSSRLDTKNCIIYGGNRLIATIGVKDLIVVDTGDVILICDKKKDQEIKKLVNTIIKDEQLNKFI